MSRTTKRAFRLISAAAGGYLLGTVPSADVASRVATGGSVDLRASGTGNPGGMNARRVLGHGIGAAVIGADIGKGAVACGWGRRRAGDVGAHVAGAAAVAGHCYPLWSRFRGGKGVATSFGQCGLHLPRLRAGRCRRGARGRAGAGLAAPGACLRRLSSIVWLRASVAWWRRGLPNLWGPRPTAALPLANAATVLVIASRAVALLRRREPDELALPR